MSQLYGQLISGQFENVTADPTPTAQTVGRVIFRTDLGVFKIQKNATTWSEGLDADTIQVLQNKILLTPDYPVQSATPGSNPAAGNLRLYPKSDGNWYGLDSSGVETQIGGGGGADDTINLCPNSGAETGLTGWSTFTSPGTDPLVLGAYTPGSSAVLTQETSDPITGSSSFRLTSDGSIGTGFSGVKIALDPLPARYIGQPVVVSFRVSHPTGVTFSQILSSVRDNTNARQMRQYGAHRAASHYLPGDNTSRGLTVFTRQSCTITHLYYGTADVNDWSDAELFIALASNFGDDVAGDIIFDEVKVTPLAEYDGPAITFGTENGGGQWTHSLSNDNNTSWTANPTTTSHMPIEPGGAYDMNVKWQITASGTLTLPNTNGGFYSSHDARGVNANLQVGGNSSWVDALVLGDDSHFHRGGYSISSGGNHQFNHRLMIVPNTVRINSPLLSLTVTGSFSVNSTCNMVVYGGRSVTAANFRQHATI